MSAGSRVYISSYELSSLVTYYTTVFNAQTLSSTTAINAQIPSYTVINLANKLTGNGKVSALQCHRWLKRIGKCEVVRIVRQV